VENSIKEAIERLKLCSTNQCNICGRYEKEECMLERNRCEQHILSDYKRVLKENESVNKSIELILNLIEKLLKENEQLRTEVNSLKKENEELRAKWDKDTHILQNKLDYANADRIDLAQQNKELRKENEELNNRCRNLDKEAQAYLEELAGDNTLTRRTIKQLQEENEELNEKILDNAGIYQLGFKDGEESYIKKVKDKIEEINKIYNDIPEDEGNFSKAILIKEKQVLQELLEGRKI